MKKYEKVYGFNVVSELEKGEKVYFLDREKTTNAIISLKDLPVWKIFELIKSDEADTNNRYEFFKKNEVKDE